MAKLKYTKNELKQQRSALGRYRRYLPTLQLKKTQLQMEARQIEAKLLEKTEQINALQGDLRNWVKLFSEPIDLTDYLQVERVKLATSNIAGVSIPVIEHIIIKRFEYDLFLTPAWLDDAVVVMENLIRLSIERENLAEQFKLISNELRTTSQRVNLFEKVKIPEAQSNISVIRVFLGNQETVDVARAKMAKRKTVNRGAVI